MDRVCGVSTNLESCWKMQMLLVSSLCFILFSLQTYVYLHKNSLLTLFYSVLFFHSCPQPNEEREQVKTFNWTNGQRPFEEIWHFLCFLCFWCFSVFILQCANYQDWAIGIATDQDSCLVFYVSFFVLNKH